MNIEEISFQIILNGGNARVLAMEAINLAKSEEFELAEQKIEEANESMRSAHHYQTNLIQKEANGEKIETKILLIHAQDHLMNAMTVIDLAKELMSVYKKMDSIISVKRSTCK